jgi:hypothetical protein
VAGEQDDADRRGIPDTTTCTKPLEKGLWGLVSKLLTGRSSLGPVISGGMKHCWLWGIEETVGDAVFRNRNEVRRHTSAVPRIGQSELSTIWRTKIMGYEESNAAGAWRYGGAADGVVGPRPVSITWRWPTLQIGQSGGRSSMTIVD